MKTIHLRGQKNLRDIGGRYKDVEIKLNHLLRGRMLNSLGPKQIETLKVKYHLRTIIDLRDLAEQAQKPGERRRRFRLKVDCAGKTGTAENPHGRDHGWFVAYGPFDNPTIVVAVIVEQGGFGSQSAVPIGRKILEAAFGVNQPGDKEQAKQ